MGVLVFAAHKSMESAHPRGGFLKETESNIMPKEDRKRCGNGEDSPYGFVRLSVD